MEIMTARAPHSEVSSRDKNSVRELGSSRLISRCRLLRRSANVIYLAAETRESAAAAGAKPHPGGGGASALDGGGGGDGGQQSHAKSSARVCRFEISTSPGLIRSDGDRNLFLPFFGSYFSHPVNTKSHQRGERWRLRWPAVSPFVRRAVNREPEAENGGGGEEQEVEEG